VRDGKRISLQAKTCHGARNAQNITLTAAKVFLVPFRKATVNQLQRLPVRTAARSSFTISREALIAAACWFTLKEMAPTRACPPPP
jgi:hypothetical protein